MCVSFHPLCCRVTISDRGEETQSRGDTITMAQKVLQGRYDYEEAESFWKRAAGGETFPKHSRNTRDARNFYIFLSG